MNVRLGMVPPLQSLRRQTLAGKAYQTACLATATAAGNA